MHTKCKFLQRACLLHLSGQLCYMAIHANTGIAGSPHINVYEHGHAGLAADFGEEALFQVS